MTLERKVVRDGILFAGAVAMAVALVALGEQGGRTPAAWAAVASALAVLAALASALGTHKIIELQETPFSQRSVWRSISVVATASLSYRS